MQVEGLIAATFTPFDKDGKIELSVIKPIVDRLAANMISGIYIGGSTGEGHSLTVAERKILAESFVRAANGRIKAIVNVGHNCLEDACELTRHAMSIGADAVSAAPPMYYKITSELQLIKVLRKITEAAPDLPFFYYHIPAITKIELNMPEFLRLSGTALPSLQGIKFTSSHIHEFQQCREQNDGKYQILFGLDEMMLSGLAAGADCMIGSTYNFMPGIYLEIIENFKNGNLQVARKLQHEAVNVINAFLKFSPLPAQKSIMRMVGMDCGPVRLPLIDLTTDEERKLKDELVTTGFFNWAEANKYRIAADH